MHATIKTTRGDISIDLFQDKAELVAGGALAGTRVLEYTVKVAEVVGEVFKK